MQSRALQRVLLQLLLCGANGDRRRLFQVAHARNGGRPRRALQRGPRLGRQGASCGPEPAGAGVRAPHDQRGNQEVSRQRVQRYRQSRQLRVRDPARNREHHRHAAQCEPVQASRAPGVSDDGKQGLRCAAKSHHALDETVGSTKRSWRRVDCERMRKQETSGRRVHN